MLHGTVLKISNANELFRANISRENFLNKDLKTSVESKVAAKKPILFLGNDVSETFKKHIYQLTIHGILPCGSKTTINIQGIDPYVVIRLKDKESEREVKNRIIQIASGINDEYNAPSKIEIREGKDFLYYDHNTHKYAHVHFKTLRARSLFIDECKKISVKTYSNDKSTYYRVVSRDYEINLSGWNVLQKYSIAKSSPSKGKYIFDVNIEDIIPVSDEKQLEKFANEQKIDYSTVKYENMIIASFDIEMIPAKPDRFPDADKNPKDSIFMICMTYHFVKRPDAILSVCLTLKETDPLEDVLVVHCASESCLLESFAKFMSFMQPDFITEFNGGGFDWRNIITKAKIFGVLPNFLEDMSLVSLSEWEKDTKTLNMFHRESRIKIGGTTADSICKGLKMQGFVAFDTLVVFKQLEPNADSHKLNECLKRCNLGSKDDLDVQEMFRIYRKGNRTEMKLVAHYCYIDTFKLQQLLIKKNVIQDRREVAMLSYTSLQDGFNFAGGSKMRNLLMNRGSKLGYYFDTNYRPEIEDAEAKFPGAHVVPPIKGVVKPMLRLDEFALANSLELTDSDLAKGYKFIEENFNKLYVSKKKVNKVPEAIETYIHYVEQNENQYPISGLDFASLYPSIIMTYNISPEKLVIDEQYANQLKKMGKTLQHVSFPFCDKTMNAWFVRHNNVVENYSVCGKLLIELFDRRAALKKVLKHLNEKLYDMEQELKPYAESGRIQDYPKIEEYNEIKFDQAACDSKQKAVKIFMNTLYGEMGNTLSCICAVEVSGSVTAMGRYNLRLMKAFVESELGMKVYYGDTDSLYVACNQRYFLKYDEEYYAGKVDKMTYATNLVQETFEQIEIAKNLVNEQLCKDNGSKFLKMAYEEVLYPAIFFSKKKYCGIPHEEKVDFYPRKPFIRGLEIVKRGASDVMKDVSFEVLMQLLDIKNNREPIPILKDAISKFFNTNWSIDAFAKTKVYRTDKNNIAVQTMMSRYRDMNYHSIPDPNVRFKYVICKYYPWVYDIEGRQTKNSIGDCMELVERVKEEGLEIDLEYYFDNELTGQFARLITFCDEIKSVAPETIHMPENTSNMTETQIEALQKDIYQRNEDALFKAAKKYIGQLAKHYSKAYTNKAPLFASTWREVSNMIRSRPDIVAKQISEVNRVITNIFTHSTGIIEQDLFSWATRHIANRYGVVVDDAQAKTLQKKLDKIARFIKSENMESCLTNYIGIWKKNIVEFIREDYDYISLCKTNSPVNNVWEVLSKQELEIIILNPSLIPKIDPDFAMTVIDRISTAIATTLDANQLAKA